MTSAYFWSFLTPPPPLSAFVRLWTPPLGNDVRPWHTPPPFCEQIFTKFWRNLCISKKIVSNKYNHKFLREINFIFKFKGWVFLFIHLLRLQQNILFCWCHHWSNPPPPMSGFVSISLTPPPPLGRWRHMWMAPFDFLNICAVCYCNRKAAEFKIILSLCFDF